MTLKIVAIFRAEIEDIENELVDQALALATTPLPPPPEVSHVVIGTGDDP